MLFRLKLITGIFCLVSLAGCSSMKMATGSKFDTNFDEYEITEKAGVFSGDKVTFGHYQATNVALGWTKGSSRTMIFFKDADKSQHYTYAFTGMSSWQVECNMAGKEKSLMPTGLEISFGMERGVHCTFVPNEENPSLSKFEFNLNGPNFIDARGSFEADTTTISVEATNEVQGSSFNVGIPSGYFFYAGDKLLAGVDKINKQGPVWFSKEINQETKEKISLVVVALLLLQDQK